MSTEHAFNSFYAGLARFLPADNLITDLPRRIALACDASFYSLVPKLVVYVPDSQSMQRLLALASQFEIAVTFRAAGTSLSGQAVSDSVLVMLSRNWTAATVHHEGRQITLEPGVIGARANAVLAPWGRKIGPDPASINSCKIGGIAANNASGMCCGVAKNSYHTLAAMTLILADGTRLDTRDDNSVAAFRQSHGDLLSALKQQAWTIRHHPALAAHIRHQFRLKNTMGYGLNALLDYDDPIDILCHLMIGSEGTLGFIADITFDTVPVPSVRQTGLYLFADSQSACAAIPLLRDCDADAVELMDCRALRAVATLLAPFYRDDIPQGAVALLIDIGDEQQSRLHSRLTRITEMFDALPATSRPVPMCAFTDNAATITTLWDIRKGLFPAVGAVRESGTTVIIEDVAFDLASLPEGLGALSNLFEDFGYDDAIIFGHALDGNLHFVFSQGVGERELARYDEFMQAVVNLVSGRYNGSLKAEHGTGRNMAPFLLQQWGEEGVTIMRTLKQLIDPRGILNPGVILNDDPRAHVKNVKRLPEVDDIIDSCIECGFCEPACPSLHHTLSPRQRIALARRAVSLPADEQQMVEHAAGDLSVDSCAATGMCASRCPVGINTGTWILKLRAQHASEEGQWRASHYALTTRLQRGALHSAAAVTRLVGKTNAARVSKALNTLSHGRVPFLLPSLSRPPSLPTTTSQPLPDALYLPACPNRLLGEDNSKHSLYDIVRRLGEKAGLTFQIPENYLQVCCGQPFISHGNTQATRDIQARLGNVLDTSLNHRDIPVIVDASACALTAKGIRKSHTYELSEYLLQHVVPRLAITPVDEPVMLHVSCSSTHMDNGRALRQLAALCANRIVEVQDIACCGFAGDKGFTRPDLNAAALATLSGQVPDGCRRGVSNSRGCELGLSHHSGIRFSHIAYLLDEVSA